MEMCYINSGKPELAINSFLQMQFYHEALRIAKKHRPDMVQTISHHLDKGADENMSGDELL